MTDAMICRLTDSNATDPDRTGGKGANLAVLTRAGLPVPAGFVVSTAAYREFVEEHRLDAVIQRELADIGDPDTVDAASSRLRRAFESAPMSPGVRNRLAAAGTTLGDCPLAVRSSATAEDLPEASFAGQQDTLLNVVGAEALCDAVRRCWSSLWTARAIAYRRDQGIGHENISVAVVVQQMVPAEVAGVLFTADPVSGRRDHVVIEAAAGLGEAVVGGGMTPERWIIDAPTREVLTRPARALLVPEHLDTLMDLATRSARLFGTPQDIEWAVHDGRCWLLQSRPITSPFPIPPATVPGLRVYLPVMLFAQGIAEPMTPAGNTFFRAMVSGWFRFWISGQRPGEIDEAPAFLPIVADRLFLDATAVLQRPRVAARLVANFRLKDPTGSEALRMWLSQNNDRLPQPNGPTLPCGLVRWIPSLLLDVTASLVAPARARRRLIAGADSAIARLDAHAIGLSTPQEQLNFVERVLPAATCDMMLRQLAAAYAEWLTRVVIQRSVRRWLGSSQGFDPVVRWLPHDPTIAMGAALARLARDHAAAGIEPSPGSPGVAEFLATFGHRAPDREVDLGLPRLTDDPTYVVELINGYQRSGELDTFEAGAEQSRTAAAELVADVRRIRGPLRAAILKNLLGRHTELGGLRERPKFDMVRAMALGRRTLKRCAATLVDRGLLDDPDDVFFVDGADVRVALAGGPRDLRALARANRRSFRRELARRLVPRVLTSDGEAVYASAPTSSDDTNRMLVGTPLSPGVYEGVVRVLDSPVGATLQPGEVLVAASTDPGWTPLFLLAGALVMEVGGVVSHGALVAREYGIPALAGITDAMTRLHTGQRVRVDGTAGRITLIEPTSDEGQGVESVTAGRQPSRGLSRS
ncbi:PEP/pyruvate-binding domain-containing protein [Mycolicibacterium arenosum]|uniref:PEP-utilizing enzyme n=1 Tax=Mycolicibacterium arenosum TaxID=2952157 RepID=A0ABT1LW52_9MYCO|nr:PEP/pyruvate-binding domain-containing protein [Mycolicibacterium sp. CAU 1645]MCP9271129.1 PEP-utilizing enzyme [Mycolicibacterium sp. CAU 1645]